MADGKAKRLPVDWEAVEREYRAGIKTLRQIGEEFGCSHVGVKKKAEREGWPRDLSAKIKELADAKVTKALVTKEVTKETAVSERQVIEASAEMMAEVIRSHHRLLTRLRGIAMLLLDRLEAELEGTDLFRQLGEMMASPDEFGVDKVGDLYRKVIALPTQTDTAKKLSEMLKTIIELERKVFKIDEQKQADVNPLAELIRAVSGTALPVTQHVSDDDDE